MKNSVRFLSLQLIFLFFAFAVFAQKPAKKTSIENKAFEVSLPISVTDAEKKYVNCPDGEKKKDKKVKQNPLVKCFKKNDFIVFEDGVRQKITSFIVRKTNPPVYVGVLMDTSSSTAEKLPFSKRAASDFLYTVVQLRKDKGAFMTFDNEINLIQDFTDKLDLLDKAVDKIKIDKVKKGGAQAALYDAIWQFADEKLRNAPGRRVIVFISDGTADTLSRADLNDAIDIAQRTETTIFGIFTSEPSDNNLVRLSEETGGESFFVKQLDEFERAFTNVSKAIRSPYTITYRPTNQKYDGRRRKIEVRFNKKNNAGKYRIVTRSEYRAVRDSLK